MRRDIDRNPQRIKKVLMEDGLRSTFLKGVPKQEAKAVKAFVASNAENALKTKPKVSWLYQVLLLDLHTWCDDVDQSCDLSGASHVVKLSVIMGASYCNILLV